MDHSDTESSQKKYFDAVVRALPEIWRSQCIVYLAR